MIMNALETRRTRILCTKICINKFKKDYFPRTNLKEEEKDNIL
jgi:hypothetical protein